MVFLHENIKTNQVTFFLPCFACYEYNKTLADIDDSSYPDKRVLLSYKK